MGQRVLVVDDNSDAGETLVEALNLFGYEARMALDGASALEVVRVWRPVAVLLDLGLPDLDGLEVARRLRSSFGREQFLVALTGYGSSDDKAATAAAGFDEHVVKPIDFDDLRELLERRLPRESESTQRL